MIANSPLPSSSRAASSVSPWPMPSAVAWLTKKLRASCSASASHVSTRMPRSCAFLNAVEILARFSTATAITSTPLVIQLSTSSFWRAASRPVGPSQMRSTPSSAAAASAPTRQLTKYGSPFAFGIIAMTVRFDGAPDAAPGELSDRTSHTFVPATMSEPSRMAAHTAQQPDCSSREILHPDRRARCRGLSWPPLRRAAERAVKWVNRSTR